MVSMTLFYTIFNTLGWFSPILYSISLNLSYIQYSTATIKFLNKAGGKLCTELLHVTTMALPLAS